MDRQLGGSTVSDTPAVLIDCDGVLVDNLEFEQQVTASIIQVYADQSGISLTEAEVRWAHELSDTRGNERWYDYGFHACRLGLDGIRVAREAHYAARDLLKLVNGVEATITLLQEYGLQACVVTDATRWVVEFKLSALGFSSMLPIFSSTDALATKASSSYWRKLNEQYMDLHPKVLIDNRQVNLVTASTHINSPHLVQFDKEEHVMTLSTTVAPTSEVYDESLIHVVRNHVELQHWLKTNIL